MNQEETKKGMGRYLNFFHDSFMIRVLRPGFTLIEVLIVFSLISIVGALALASATQSKRTRDLHAAGEQVLSVLRVAQSKALGGINRASWGVHVQSDRVVIFQGPAYLGSPSTETFMLADTVEVANLSLAGGGSDILFNRLDGRTNQAGTFDVRVKSAPAETYGITVDAAGKSYRTGSVPAILGTRVTDTRHRNFNLAGTIKNSSNLILRFSDSPNPDTVNTVPMDPPAPRTSFDWSGTVAVGGQDQTLRIHALTIGDSGTLLSVDRSCEQNNKKLKISFDANDVATYEADCETITVWAFGGTMTEP